MKRAAAVLAVTMVATVAQAELPPKKFEGCRFNPHALIGLGVDELKAKCGLPSAINSTTSAHSRRDQWVYQTWDGESVLMVYLENGVVTTVQDR